jgi:hypothetical protein
MSGASKPTKAFAAQLRDFGYSAAEYLRDVRAIARDAGYKNMPRFSTDDVHKLEITAPSGEIKRFGAVGYGDYLLWLSEEQDGLVDKGFANKKRAVFRKSHLAMSKKYKLTDKYAPNNLAIKILWPARF